MTITSTRITVDLANGWNIKTGLSIYITDYMESFPNSENNLINGDAQDLLYASFEVDMWLLDGSYKFLQETSPDIGVLSSEISQSTTNFANVPDIKLDLGADYTLENNITFKFSERLQLWPDTLTIYFQNSSHSTISTASGLTPDAPIWTYELSSSINNVRYVVFYFGSMNTAYRRLRLLDVTFDMVTFGNDVLRNAHIIEQFNPIATELPSNSLEFTVYSDDGDLSITNPQGIYALLQDSLKIDVYETVDGVEVYMGRFFLDDWESISEYEAKFTAIDGIALLDKHTFYCNRLWYTIGYVLDGVSGEGIFSSDVDIDYEISDSALKNIVMWTSGSAVFPITTKREALQHLCFTYGLTASCARSDKIQIAEFLPAEDLTAYDFTLTEADKGILSPVILKRAVTAINISSHEYVQITGAEVNYLFSGALANGTYLYTFDTPSSYYVWEDTETTQVSPDVKGAYFTKFTITTPDDYLIRDAGWYYDVNKETRIVANTSAPDNAKNNILIFDNAYMLKPDGTPSGDPTSTTFSDCIDRLLAYYNQRFVQKTKLFGSTIKAGDSVLIDTQSSQQIQGFVERSEIDLTGGFVSQIEIVGVLV